MSGGRKRNKFQLVKEHRVNQYLHILDKVIEGRAEPQELRERWQKLKEVKP